MIRIIKKYSKGTFSSRWVAYHLVLFNKYDFFICEKLLEEK